MPRTLSLLDEVAATLESAGRPDLVDRLRAQWEKDLTSQQAAVYLGVSSPNTVKNWLDGGHFPGAYKTPGGHWRFPLAEVQAVRDAMEQLRRRNREGDLAPPDTDDRPVPLL